ncbi:MAG: cytochrome c [Chitinophagaceae bacterium]|nr:MAG: cytochrome c [Chitinophagaceae bacterium]
MKLKLTLLLVAFSLTLVTNGAPPIEEGKTIFTTRCAGCHNINKVLTGPALGGVNQRRSIDWIINFVHSSQTVIKGGDKDAIALFKQFNNIPMPDHKDLSAAQIKNVVEYIKTEAGAENKETNEKKIKPTTETYSPIVFKNYGYLISLFAVFALLLGTILFALKVNKYKKYYYSQKRENSVS